MLRTARGPFRLRFPASSSASAPGSGLSFANAPFQYSHVIGYHMPRIRGSSACLRALYAGALTAFFISGCAFLRRPDPPIDRSQDPRIQQEVVARLTAEPSIDVSTIRVAVDGAVVVLHGSVQGLGAWRCAVTTSGLVSGVRSVADYLVIERGPRDVACLAPQPETRRIPQFQ
jgi:hypothetical protein